MARWFTALAVVAVALAWDRSWFPKLLQGLYPLGVAVMEDVRIPEPVLDILLRPALRVSFYGLVAQTEGPHDNDVGAVPSFADSLRRMPVALFTADANEQHYEVETAFFDIALGKRKKYSAGLWDPGTAVADAGGPLLEAAEERMLDAYVQRAGVEDGMSILDLGCGWGSVTLYLAERFPNARITSVSNSRTQRAYILEQARLRGFSNVDVKTLNVARPEFDEFLIGLGGSLDRIISIEMFEHMKNYESLMRSLSVALKPQGKLFVHIMCHKYVSYHFEEDDLNGWMTTHFFKGGTMPSQFLLQGFQQDLVLENQWNVNGQNYTLTLEGWLQRMDKRREDLLGVFGDALPLRRWRVFMIACAEYFRFRGGSEFFVTHLLFKKRA
ncbi:unnamed protein product [Prorocentrum cordatum]|uniref:Uncharacterized protein n=1 Tax=Prorocentrum cordatum TaxID=2364126 RepID=A0ABN9Y1U4_9DINO|nr:unnamed protein product [Polarella glacialis]|mmetsp:Transcript_61114/g.158645  ORF Transcript_61114/g.158645 Transcript_61114/m.158645 type:complete len:384 (+) Transcript_61114:108-1259(+)